MMLSCSDKFGGCGQTAELGENAFGRLGPDDGLGIAVVLSDRDIRADGVLKLRETRNSAIRHCCPAPPFVAFRDERRG
jgi:hypothetical protein